MEVAYSCHLGTLDSGYHDPCHFGLQLADLLKVEMDCRHRQAKTPVDQKIAVVVLEGDFENVLIVDVRRDPRPSGPDLDFHRWRSTEDFGNDPLSLLEG